MSFLAVLGFVLLFCCVVAAFSMMAEAPQRPMNAAQRALSNAEALHGKLNPALICPHCTEKGKVHTKPITKKAGVSGAKATGAILTGGLSLVATGLSRKEGATKAFCRNCSSTWEF
jgi:hypothetical protein